MEAIDRSSRQQLGPTYKQEVTGSSPVPPTSSSESGCDAPYNRGMVKGPSGLRLLRWPAAALVLAASLGLGACPLAAARDAYVGNEDDVSVSVIDTQTNQAVGSPISVEGEPAGIAITPDGKRAYVANVDRDSVSVIDTATNQVVGSPITVGDLPIRGRDHPRWPHAYVTNAELRTSVSVIDTQTNQVVGSPIPVGEAALRRSRSPPTARAPMSPTLHRAASR